jgi:hypothetical protein
MSLNSLSIEFATAEQQPANSGPMVKSLLAHEFLHALQFTIDRAASCKDLEWLDEADRAVGDGPPRAHDRPGAAG